MNGGRVPPLGRTCRPALGAQIGLAAAFNRLGIIGVAMPTGCCG